jgi:hypothetical protein
LVAAQSIEADELAARSEMPTQARQAVQQLVETAMMIDATEDLAAL